MVLCSKTSGHVVRSRVRLRGREEWILVISLEFKALIYQSCLLVLIGTSGGKALILYHRTSCMFFKEAHLDVPI